MTIVLIFKHHTCVLSQTIVDTVKATQRSNQQDSLTITCLRVRVYVKLEGNFAYPHEHLSSFIIGCISDKQIAFPSSQSPPSKIQNSPILTRTSEQPGAGPRHSICSASSQSYLIISCRPHLLRPGRHGGGPTSASPVSGGGGQWPI